MANSNYDIDTIDAITELIDSYVEHYEKAAHMWYMDSVKRDTINDNEALEWQMWNTDMNKIAVLHEIQEQVDELKTAEIFRRANVVYVHH